MLFPSITLSDRFPFLQRCALLDAQGPFPLPLPLQRPILFSLWLDDQFCLPSGFRFLKPGRRPFQVWGLEEFAQGPQKAGKLHCCLWMHRGLRRAWLVNVGGRLRSVQRTPFYKMDNMIDKSQLAISEMEISESTTSFVQRHSLSCLGTWNESGVTRLFWSSPRLGFLMISGPFQDFLLMFKREVMESSIPWDISIELAAWPQRN